MRFLANRPDYYLSIISSVRNVDDVADIVIDILEGLGMLIVSVFLWRHYIINTTIKSLWHNFQTNCNKRSDNTLDDVSGGVSTTNSTA